MDLTGLLEEVKQIKPQMYKIKDICEITRGRVISKLDIAEHSGEYPVYSSQTANNGELGKINTYDFDGEYVSWTTDGAKAGTVFYRQGKFSITNVCGLLKTKVDFVNPKFLYYILGIVTDEYVNRSVNNHKLMSNVMGEIEVTIPSLDMQNKIVHFLDAFTALITALRTEEKKRKEKKRKEKNNISLTKKNYFLISIL